THQRVVPTIDVVARMRRCQPFEIDLHTSGKRIIGRILAGEERISAAVRYRVEVENAAHRRLLVTGDIRVPIFPVDALGIGIGMDRQNLGMSFGPGRAGMNMQFTEISAEPLVGFHIQRLIAKEQNLVLRQRLMQPLDLTVAEWLSQCDALDIGADARCNWRDTYGFVAHGMTFRWCRGTDRPHSRMHHSCFNLLRFTICQFNTTGCNDLCCLARLHHSAFTPENLTTLAHFAVSSAMSLPKSAGESASTSPPRSASRAFIVGSARPALISLLSFSTISA